MPNPKPPQIFFPVKKASPGDGGQRIPHALHEYVWVRKLASDVKQLRRKRVWCEKNLERILFRSSNFLGGEVPGSSLSGLLIERRRWVVLCCSRVPKSLRHSDSWRRWCVFFPFFPFLLLPLLFFLYSLASFSAGIFVGTCGFCDAEFEVLISWKERSK